MSSTQTQAEQSSSSDCFPRSAKGLDVFSSVEEGTVPVDLGAFNPPAVELSLKKKESQSKYLNIISFPVSVV